MNLISKFFLGLGIAYVAAVVFTNSGYAETISPDVVKPSVRIGEYCSGTVIFSERGQVSGDVTTIVLTAKHCTEGTKDTLVINRDVHNDKNRLTETKSYFGKLLGESYKADLALIKLKDTDTIFDTATVAPKDIKLEFGQDVQVIGYPLGRSMTWTLGNLGFVEEVPPFGKLSNTTEFYRATPDTLGGSSGSPMYTKDTDGKFKLIGVLTGGVRMGTFMNFYTPIEEIRDYLDVAEKAFLSVEDQAKKNEKKD